MEPCIISVKILPGHRLAIEFDDGEMATKDLNPLIARGNLFADLQDTKFLKKVQIIDRGYALGWPNGLELCADSLRYEVEQSRTTRRSKAALMDVG